MEVKIIEFHFDESGYLLDLEWPGGEKGSLAVSFANGNAILFASKGKPRDFSRSTMIEFRVRDVGDGKAVLFLDTTRSSIEIGSTDECAIAEEWAMRVNSHWADLRRAKKVRSLRQVRQRALFS